MSPRQLLPGLTNPLERVAGSEATVFALPPLLILSMAGLWLLCRWKGPRAQPLPCAWVAGFASIARQLGRLNKPPMLAMAGGWQGSETAKNWRKR